MPWVTIGVQPNFGGIWPGVRMRQTYRERRLLLMPESERLAATVNVECDNTEAEDALRLLKRFLSAAAWGARCGLIELMALGAGDYPGRVGRNPTLRYAPQTHPRGAPLYAPEPREQRAQLALALYREGLNQATYSYEFLSFYKILETQARGRQDLIGLTQRHLPAARQRALPLIDPPDRPTIDDGELARFLYEDARCAIAHAHGEPIIDPDDFGQVRRVWAHLPLVKSLAELVIEQDYGVSRWPPNNWTTEWEVLGPEEI